MSRTVQQTIAELQALIDEWEDTIDSADLDLTPPDTVVHAKYKLQLIKDAESFLRTLYSAFRIMVDGHVPPDSTKENNNA